MSGLETRSSQNELEGINTAEEPGLKKMELSSRYEDNDARLGQVPEVRATPASDTSSTRTSYPTWIPAGQNVNNFPGQTLALRSITRRLVDV